jgi:hypothetical protein
MDIRLRHRLILLASTACIGLAFAGVGGAVSPPATGTFLYLQSETGDPVGRGNELLYTSADSGFNLWYINGYFEASADA